MTEGKKFDAGKAPYHLLPPEALDALTHVLAFGATKYGERNWEAGMSYSRLFSAMMRHAWAWWSGEPFDKETGYSHLWHLLACVTFLVTYEEREMSSFDDRPTRQE